MSNDIVSALLIHGADVNARSEFSSIRFIWDPLNGPTALAAAFKHVTEMRSWRRQDGFRADCFKSITRKAVGARLPEELLDLIADQLVAELVYDTQSRELVKMLIEHGADTTGVANTVTSQQILCFAGGYEEIWDDCLRLGIEDGQQCIYQFDPNV